MRSTQVGKAAQMNAQRRDSVEQWEAHGWREG